MTEEVTTRAPFVIGEYVRCPHGEGRVIVSQYQDDRYGDVRVDGAWVADIQGWLVGPRPYHTHRVDELHHGHVKREWIDDD